MFPLRNFKIDGFVEKTGIYDDKMINSNNPEHIFYSAGYLLNSCYQCVGKEELNYEFFESEDLAEHEVNDGLNEYEIQKIFLKEQAHKIGLLQEKIRLLTGLAITLPVFLTTIYKDDVFYTSVGSIT